MCIARLATFLTLILVQASRVSAFETEAERVFLQEGANSELRIISTADLDVFTPIILEFQQLNPGIDVFYTVASSKEVMKAIYEENAPFDLAISSAMDLQTKLANDGFAQSYRSDATDTLPVWASWRRQVFGFTREPAVLVISESFFQGLPVPQNREQLISLLRDNPDRFTGKIGTYDVRQSGLGYLFATQDSRNSESFWRLTEVMGRLDVKLSCCSSEMIAGVVDGNLALAYNVLGSYAAKRLAGVEGVRLINLTDFSNLMLRTALIPVNARNTRAAGTMIDFLVTLKLRPDLVAETGLPPIDSAEFEANNSLRPIRLGPGLLVFLDRMKRETFLRAWVNSIQQE